MRSSTFSSFAGCSMTNLSPSTGLRKTRARGRWVLAEEGEDLFDRLGDGSVDHRQLVAVERGEDVVGDVALVVGAADADLDALDLLGTQRVDHGAHAVVAAVAALHAQAHGPQWQVDVVVDEDQVGGPGLGAAQSLRDDGPALVHERLGLDEANLLAAPAAAGHDRGPVAPPRAANGLGEDVEHALAHVVAGVLVLRTRVPKPHDHLAGRPAFRVGHARLARLLVLLGLLRARRPRRRLLG